MIVLTYRIMLKGGIGSCGDMNIYIILLVPTYHRPSAVQVASMIIITEGLFALPMRGLSDVGGIVSATMFRKNVNDSRTVTSVGKTKLLTMKSFT